VSKRLAGPPEWQREFEYEVGGFGRMVARQMNENDGRQLLQRLQNAGLETPTFWWEVSYFADVCCGLFARLIETENSDFKLEGGLDACACTLSLYRSAVCLCHVLGILARRCVCAVCFFCVRCCPWPACANRMYKRAMHAPKHMCMHAAIYHSHVRLQATCNFVCRRLRRSRDNAILSCTSAPHR
jgi:hypothetical protein